MAKVGRPRRPIEPILDRLVEGKVPKQIGHELGICANAVDYHLHRYVVENGFKNVLHAVLEYDRKKR